MEIFKNIMLVIAGMGIALSLFSLGAIILIIAIRAIKNFINNKYPWEE